MKSNIKVVEKTGTLVGKTVVVLVGVHGNETCGVNLFDNLLPNLKIESGKVIFIYANLEAIKRKKRFIEYNLNRCFLKEQPLEIRNTLEGRTAKEIMSCLDKADIVLDIHASNSPSSVPFLICGKQSTDFAQSLPFSIVSYNWDEFEKGTTDNYMNLQNKIAFCAECGYAEDKESEKRAKECLFSFLIKAGAIRGELSNSIEKKYYKLRKLYKNINSFKKSREFTDFEMLKEKTLIGFDGDTPVYAKKGEIVLFVRDREKPDEECFITAKEIIK